MSMTLKEMNFHVSFTSQERKDLVINTTKKLVLKMLWCVQMQLISIDLRLFLFNSFYKLTVLFQIRVSAVLTNAPYILNLDCDHYVNNSKAIREAMCFLMDPQVGRDVCYVQFPQRFDGIDKSDRYANRNIVFFDVSIVSN